jgi:serine/threonine-protein kinase RsbW
MRTAIFPAKYESLDAMREFVCQAAQDSHMKESDSYKVQLAVDEACSNIVEHACEGECGEEIEITCIDAKDRLTVMIRDHGRPFDPDSAPVPDLDADLEERPIGGLGVFLIKRLMDEIRYEVLGEAGNVLTLVKYRVRGE